MAKISKDAAKRHKRALDLVHSDKHLTLDDRFYILENFHVLPFTPKIDVSCQKIPTFGLLHLSNLNAGVFRAHKDAHTERDRE